MEAAGFGLAGVVVNGCLHAENLRWALEFSALWRKLNLKNVVLLNDLAAPPAVWEALLERPGVIWTRLMIKTIEPASVPGRFRC